MSDDGSQGGSQDGSGSDHSSDYNSEDEQEEGQEDEGEEEEEILNATIYNFPVEVIALERCKQTLDNLMVEDALSDEEWEAALMQIVMTLATYQKTFAFTHNDLHTNNIMFNETDKNSSIIYSIRNSTRFRRLVEYLKLSILVARFTSSIQNWCAVIAFTREEMPRLNTIANRIITIKNQRLNQIIVSIYADWDVLFLIFLLTTLTT